MMQIYGVRMRFCAERESAEERTPLRAPEISIFLRFCSSVSVAPFNGRAIYEAAKN